MKTNIHFFTIFCPVLLRMINCSDESSRENQNIHFMVSNFYSEDRAVYEIIWTNIVQRGRPQMTMAYAHCVLGT
jgi:hypothetical protein